MFIVERLTGVLHINRQIRGLFARGNMIIKGFRFCSDDVKILLFKTFCSSMYCAHVWSAYSTATFAKLRISFNKVFRILMSLERRSSISQAMLDANVNTFDIIIRNCIYSFMKRIEMSDNLVINTIINSFYHHSSPIATQWQGKLYL